MNPATTEDEGKDQDFRPDLRPVSQLLHRVLVYSRQFRSWNHDEWPHLRNQEDFDRVYRLPPAQRFPFERLYGDGRDMAVDLSHLLAAFNDVGQYPTFKSFVDAVQRYVSTWPKSLKVTIDRAESAVKQLPQSLYSVERMTQLGRQQLEMTAALHGWVRQAKRSPLYREEAGVAVVVLDRAIDICRRLGAKLVIGIIITVASALIIAALQ